jgi:outer membrane protein assembly factor BamB
MAKMNSSGRRLTLFALAALLTFTAAATAGNWARFRGPNGSGTADAEQLPVALGENVNQLWRVELPGGGNSSPIVASNHVYLQCASADGSWRALECLDLQSGRVLWERRLPGQNAKTHAKNTLASSSAAADERMVVMPFWNGTNLAVSAFDHDGNPLWSCDLGEYASQHGAGHSPVIVDGRVILAIDQDGKSDVVALSAEKGELLWRTPRPPFRASYSTPILLDRNGAPPEVLVASTAGLAAYDLASGSETWKWSWTSNDKQLRTVATPIISQGMAFVTGGNGPGDRHAVAVRLDGQGDVSKTNTVWETRKLLPYVPGMLARGDYLYFVNDDGIAGCYEARSGKSVWTQRLEGGKVFSSPVLVDGRIYCVTEDGVIFVIAAETQFSLLGSGRIEDSVIASPAVASGRLLIRGKKYLYSFGDRRQLKTGAAAK